MTSLPHGFTEPLHILEPFPWGRLLLLGLVATLVAALVLLLWRWWRRSRSATPAVPAAPPPPPAIPGILDSLEELRRRYLESALHRQGCHALSELLRRHFGGHHDLPFVFLTAQEIAGRAGDTAMTRLLRVLSDLQFARRPPGAGDFDGACDLARDVLLDLNRGSRG